MGEVATDPPVQRAVTRRQGRTEKGTVIALAIGEPSQGGQDLKGQNRRWETGKGPRPKVGAAGGRRSAEPGSGDPSYRPKEIRVRLWAVRDLGGI